MQKHVTMLLAAAVVCSVLGVVPARQASAAANDQRSYANQYYLLQLGSEQQPVRSIEGGYIRGMVVEDRVASDTGVVKKHLAGASVEPIRAQIGVGQFTDVLRDQIEKVSRFNGSVMTMDYQGKATQRQDFQNAYVSEIDIPTLSAASKDVLWLQIEVTPEILQRSSASSQGGAKASSKQQKVLASSFRVQIPGLNASRVRQVDAISLKRKSASDAVGETRDYQKTPMRWEVPNIVLHIAAADAQEFVNWHDDFVVRGNNGDDKEKTLTLEILDPSLKTPLMTLEASNVGIISVAPGELLDSGGGKSDAVAEYRVELYAERMTIAGKSGSGAAAAAAQTGGDVAQPGGGGTETTASPPAARTRRAPVTQPRRVRAPRG